MSHRYRAYPAPLLAAQCARHCADARFVWNLALEQADLYRRHWGPTPGPAERQRQLADARQGSWLGDGSSSVQQQALRDFDRAMQNWWAGTHDHPTWRRKHLHEGFCVRDVKVQRLNRRWAQVQVPKHGPDRANWLRFRLSRPLPERHGAARVTLDRAGRWHVSFTAEPKALGRQPTGAVVGVDRGVANTLATSDGETAHAPSLSAGEQAEHERRQVEMSRCQRSDPMREVHRRACARSYARLADRRKNWVEQSTTDLVRRCDRIVVERLNVRGMVRSAKGTAAEPGTNVRAKSGLNRAILAQCWGLWLRRLKEKAALCGVEVVEVPAAFTSQRCHRCGHTSAGNRESQAVFLCERCGHGDHADLNAAKNIVAKARTGPEPQASAA